MSTPPPLARKEYPLIFVLRRTEREMLLALYWYNLLTSQRLSILQHDEQHTIYNTCRTLKEKYWVELLPLNFVQKYVKGWTLSRDGMEVALG